ncbi:MAG: hypothetical protein ACRDYA_03160 [Egibacteraceae bacterium]
MPAYAQRGASPLTAITPIIPGREETVEAVLEDLQRRLDEAGDTGLSGIGTVHFARWVMLRNGDRAQLLFASHFDGTWDNYMDDFIAHAWQLFDAVWSNCEGYPDYGARDSVAFKDFVRKHQLKEHASFRGYDASAAEIRRALKISRGVKQVLEGLQELS